MPLYCSRAVIELCQFTAKVNSCGHRHAGRLVACVPLERLGGMPDLGDVASQAPDRLLHAPSRIAARPPGHQTATQGSDGLSAPAVDPRRARATPRHAVMCGSVAIERPPYWSAGPRWPSTVAMVTSVQQGGRGEVRSHYLLRSNRARGSSGVTLKYPLASVEALHAAWCRRGRRAPCGSRGDRRLIHPRTSPRPGTYLASGSH